MKTIGQVVNEIQSIKTREEASLYIIKELQENPHAWTNIKYLTGYLGNEERNRILGLFTGK